jgi:hypothetical protein
MIIHSPLTIMATMVPMADRIARCAMV